MSERRWRLTRGAPALMALALALVGPPARSATSEPWTVDVVVAPDEGASELTGVTLSLSYPRERVTLPDGPAGTVLLQQRVQLATPDDGHDDLLVVNGTTAGVLRIVYVRQPLASAAAIESGPLLRVSFDRAVGDGAAVDDLRCEVVNASDRMARPRTNVTCRVQIPRP